MSDYYITIYEIGGKNSVLEKKSLVCYSYSGCDNFRWVFRMEKKGAKLKGKKRGLISTACAGERGCCFPPTRALIRKYVLQDERAAARTRSLHAHQRGYRTPARGTADSKATLSLHEWVH